MSKFIKRGLPLLVIAFLTVQVIAWNAESMELGSISQANLLSQIQQKKSLLILDVRTPKEYDAGHIPGAINIDFKELPKRIDEIDRFKNSTVVLYCERGIRAKVAETTLQKAGFKSLLHLEGNMSSWRNNSLPIQKS